MSLDQMWERLAKHQPFADERGYGPEWALMCEQRTEQAARSAADSAAAAWVARSATDSAAAAWVARAPAMAAEWAAASSCMAPAWAGPAAAIDWIEKAEEEK